MVGIQNFNDTFDTRKRSFISAFSICMTIPLIDSSQTSSSEQTINLVAKTI